MRRTGHPTPLSPRRALPGLAVTALAVLLLSGCATAGTGPAAQPAETPDGVTGEWTLTSGTDDAGSYDLSATSITLTIGDTSGGSTPCNSYGADVTGGLGDITVTPTFQTEMACVDQSLMDLEKRYLTDLALVDTADVDGSVLQLSGADVVLTYEFVVPIENSPIVGTAWVLDSLVLTRGADGSASSVIGDATLLLREDGVIEGNAGCRGFSGTYEIDDSDAARPTVDVSDLVFDAADCPAEFVDQENQVELVLDDFFAEVQGDRMTLTADFQEMGLVYRVAGTEVLPPAVLPTTGVPCEGLGVDSGSEAGNGTTGSAGDPDVLCTN